MKPGSMRIKRWISIFSMGFEKLKTINMPTGNKI
jgi:hypothetical protein